MYLAANLSTQFTAGNISERCARIADAGFHAVEMQWPYDECPAAEHASILRENGLKAVLLNAPVGATPETRFGFASLPGERQAFDTSVETAAAYAGIIGAPIIHVLAGTGEGDTARKTLVGNLTRAADTLPGGLSIVIEAINREDVPGYHLAGITDAASVLDAVNRDNIGLMVDLYHAARNGEDAAAEIRTHARHIKHTQISDHPGRGEPGSGAIDFTPGIEALRAAGYRDALGCEFKPTGEPEACLGWVSALGLSF